MIKPILMATLAAATLAGCGSAQLAVAPQVQTVVPAPQPYAAIVERHRLAHGFNGVVLVGQGTQVLALVSTGVADAEAGLPVTAQTRFETGSMSKWVAAIVVMRLVDRGLLSLDAPITRYLPDYRPDTGARLTLRHLMSHSSGVPNDIAAARKADPSVATQVMTQAEAVRRYASGDLAFAPGTQWDYSHSNWLIVQAIAEQVGGKPYPQLVRDELTGPLGLEGSGIFSGDSAQVPGMARGYSALKPGPQARINPIPAYMAMAGGFYSTAPDLLRLLQGVLAGPLLSPEARRTLMTTQMPDQHYALGGRIRTETIAGQPREIAWEDGSNGGFRAIARRVLADGHSVVVLNNSSDDHLLLGQMADELLAESYAGP
ncbi:beta-lactamase family protein [Ideonella azotifigens]|uniref:Beta-lactamase-related domain-containing protein n=1 Tax=Ideonella azotifigens TaxID=513160 RepID=A0ABN1KK79_9BURK|nr:serine hydrolase domain-containing protein [Ideonella azotifigens]MCD2339273.1 beta-lactamase family protein [Ideonella azotifigens]